MAYQKKKKKVPAWILRLHLIYITKTDIMFQVRFFLHMYMIYYLKSKYM